MRSRAPSPRSSLLAADRREQVRQAREARAQRAAGERSPPGFFVTGTDTGVGKTLVACALLRGLRARGIDVGALKPIETGVGPAGPLDALALREAAGSDDTLETICPQHFALPAAPTVAAAAEGRRVELAPVRSAFAALAARHACIVVEGAGGLLVPAAEGVSMADLARELGLPLLVVTRASLGTINHTRLTLEAAAARGLGLAGVVISHGAQAISAADAENLAALRAELGARLVGEFPPLSAGQRPAASCLDLDALLRAAH
jgi:dethiobiotin synthetase